MMRRQFTILGAILLLTALAPVLTDDRFVLDMVILVLIFATFATGWNVAAGFTGLFSLGHAALFAIGAYGAVMLHLRAGLPTIVAIAVAALMAVAASVLIGLMSLRLRGHYFALATIGFGMTAFILLSNFGQVTGGDEGINLPFTPDPINLIFAGKAPYVYLGLLIYGLTAIATILLFNSKLGFQMRAIREDEVTARSMGVPALKVKMIAVAVSGVFSALAGSVFAFYTLYITPQNTADIAVSLEPALMSIIGGMSGIFGPLLGAVLIVGLEQQVITVVGAEIPGLSQAIFAVLLIISILLLPNGILGFGRQASRHIARRQDRRRAGIAVDDEVTTDLIEPDEVRS